MNKVMKTTVLLAVVICSTVLLNADITQFYSFSQSTGTYTPITGTTITGLGDNNISAPVNIGFGFTYGDIVYTQVVVSSNGWIGLGTNHSASYPDNDLSGTTNTPVLAPLWDDLSMTGCNVKKSNSGSTPNRVFTIQYQNAYWNNSSNYSTNFQVKLYESGKIEFVYGTVSGQPSPNLSASIGINKAPGGIGNYYSISPGNPALVSTSISDNAISTYPGTGLIYVFNPFFAAPLDLSITDLMGYNRAYLGVTNTYTATVVNTGITAVSDYSVSLMTGSTELLNTAGLPLQPGQNLDITLNWIPEDLGEFVIYARVNHLLDTNGSNNQTSSMIVNVFEEGTVYVIVGENWLEPLMPLRIPWDMNCRNSLFETIYPANSLITGSINYLSFSYSFSSSLTKPVNIWLGTTEQSDLVSGWIPSTMLTQVYSGNMSFQSGQHTMIIPLQTPYQYTGNNLVMMCERVMDSDYETGTYVFSVNRSSNLISRNAFSDLNDYDPANPPVGGSLNGYYPITSFYIVPGTTGNLQGTVTSLGLPLAGVDVCVFVIGNSELDTTTDANGNYSFQGLPARTMSAWFMKTGFQPQHLSVVIADDVATTLDISLNPVSFATVTGFIAGSENPGVGLPNVRVYFDSGTIFTYTATTDATGHFSITNLMMYNTYQCTVSRDGYESITGQIVADVSNIDLGTMVLNQVLLPPVNVIASANNNRIYVMWSSPFSNRQDTNTLDRATRNLLGYRVWRLRPGQENDESSWVHISDPSDDVTVAIDMTFEEPTLGTWACLWAVKAIYTGGNSSEAAFSNSLTGGMYAGLINGHVTNSETGLPIAGATIDFSHSAERYSTVTDSLGYYHLILFPLVYSIVITASGYEAYMQQVVEIINGDTTTVNIALEPVVHNPQEPEIAYDTMLISCFPNPLVTCSNISYANKGPSDVLINIYNVKGQLIKTLVDKYQKSGRYSVIWNGTDINNKQIANGVYFLRMTSGKYSATRKVMLLR